METTDTTPQTYPKLHIASGDAEMDIALPDAANGFYRSGRFDWAGVITELKFQGKVIFANWKPEAHDPLGHDFITGPADSFDELKTGPGSYDAVPVGGEFLKIGVGWLQRESEDQYWPFFNLPIVAGGEWTSQSDERSVTATHTMEPRHEMGYVYTKRLALSESGDRLTISHTLRNIGSHTIEVSSYNHNFFTLGGLRTAPGLDIDLGFKGAFLEGSRGMEGRVELKDSQLQVISAFGGDFFAMMEHFPKDGAGHTFSIQSQGAGLRVDVHVDRPLSNFMVWGCKETLCPEPYVAITAPVGGEFTWEAVYQFSTLEA